MHFINLELVLDSNIVIVFEFDQTAKTRLGCEEK